MRKRETERETERKRETEKERQSERENLLTKLEDENTIDREGQ